MHDLLNDLLFEFKEQLNRIHTTTPRTAQFSDVPHKIKIAVGMRRVGKTVFLMQTIQKLLQEKNIPLHRILYINFEDDRLTPFSSDQLVGLLHAFYQLYPENHHEYCYLFFDEIQNVEQWALVVRRFFDTKQVHIYLSGSSAKLLSKEIASSLRGRSMTTTVWPYSFSEYLMAKNTAVPQDHLYGAPTRDWLHQQFRCYMTEGGFPETINTAAFDRRQILQDYVELVMMRDIIDRYGVTHINLLRYLVKTRIANTGCRFSINKFSKDVHSQGLTGSKNTIQDYVRYIEDACLSFSISLFHESLRNMQINPKKIYAIDTGLVKAYTLSQKENLGHLFETIFFLDLKRQGCDVYYYLTKERYEVDFLAVDPLGTLKLYQVVWDDNQKSTMDRERRALEAAQKELNIDGQIITVQSYLKNQYHAHINPYRHLPTH